MSKSLWILLLFERSTEKSARSALLEKTKGLSIQFASVTEVKAKGFCLALLEAASSLGEAMHSIWRVTG